LKAFGLAINEFGIALGMGKLWFSRFHNLPSAGFLKGSLTSQLHAMNFVADYFKAVKELCSKDIADKTRCTKW